MACLRLSDTETDSPSVTAGSKRTVRFISREAGPGGRIEEMARAAMARLVEAVANVRPDVVVPVDFPDFNLRLASRVRGAGAPVVYFVSPSV